MDDGHVCKQAGDLVVGELISAKQTGGYPLVVESTARVGGVIQLTCTVDVCYRPEETVIVYEHACSGSADVEVEF